MNLCNVHLRQHVMHARQCSLSSYTVISVAVYEQKYGILRGWKKAQSCTQPPRP